VRCNLATKHCCALPASLWHSKLLVLILYVDPSIDTMAQRTIALTQPSPESPTPSGRAHARLQMHTQQQQGKQASKAAAATAKAQEIAAREDKAAALQPNRAAACCRLCSCCEPQQGGRWDCALRCRGTSNAQGMRLACKGIYMEHKGLYCCALSAPSPLAPCGQPYTRYSPPQHQHLRHVYVNTAALHLTFVAPPLALHLYLLV
jgi:hypothetical protein